MKNLGRINGFEINENLNFKNFFENKNFGIGLHIKKYFYLRFEQKYNKMEKISKFSEKLHKIFFNFFFFFFLPNRMFSNCILINILFLNLGSVYRGWRHFKGFPSRGQRTRSNGNTSFKNNLLLRNYKKKILKKYYGTLGGPEQKIAFLCEYVNYFWKQNWFGEWCYSRFYLYNNLLKKRSFSFDFIATAKYYLGYLRKNNSKVSKKKKKMLTGVVGFDYGGTKAFLKLKYDLTKKQKKKLKKLKKKNKNFLQIFKLFNLKKIDKNKKNFFFLIKYIYIHLPKNFHFFFFFFNFIYLTNFFFLYKLKKNDVNFLFYFENIFIKYILKFKDNFYSKNFLNYYNFFLINNNKNEKQIEVLNFFNFNYNIHKIFVLNILELNYLKELIFLLKNYEKKKISINEIKFFLYKLIYYYEYNIELKDIFNKKFLKKLKVIINKNNEIFLIKFKYYINCITDNFIKKYIYYNYFNFLKSNNEFFLLKYIQKNFFFFENYSLYFFFKNFIDFFNFFFYNLLEINQINYIFLFKKHNLFDRNYIEKKIFDLNLVLKNTILNNDFFFSLKNIDIFNINLFIKNLKNEFFNEINNLKLNNNLNHIINDYQIVEQDLNFLLLELNNYLIKNNFIDENKKIDNCINYLNNDILDSFLDLNIEKINNTLKNYMNLKNCLNGLLFFNNLTKKSFLNYNNLIIYLNFNFFFFFNDIISYKKKYLNFTYSWNKQILDYNQFIENKLIIFLLKTKYIYFIFFNCLKNIWLLNNFKFFFNKKFFFFKLNFLIKIKNMNYFYNFFYLNKKKYKYSFFYLNKKNYINYIKKKVNIKHNLNKYIKVLLLNFFFFYKKNIFFIKKKNLFNFFNLNLNFILQYKKKKNEFLNLKKKNVFFFQKEVNFNILNIKKKFFSHSFIYTDDFNIKFKKTKFKKYTYNKILFVKKFFKRTKRDYLNLLVKKFFYKNKKKKNFFHFIRKLENKNFFEINNIFQKKLINFFFFFFFILIKPI